MRDALLICLKALESLGIGKTTREFAISNAREVLKRDREADRLRFTDLAFNAWLDESITENGEFSVWDNIKCVESAWHGWNISKHYVVKPVVPRPCEGCRGYGMVGNIIDQDECPFCKGSGEQS